MTTVLEVRGLTTEYRSPRTGIGRTLDGLTFAVRQGEILGIVGETGAGKSVLVRTVIGLLGPSERVTSGEVLFEGKSLPITDDEAMVAYRGAQIALIQSGARARLDPVQRIGSQLIDVMSAHRKIEKDEGRLTAENLIRSVGIPDAAHQLRSYPHELSGGMCQRVVVAMALANSPRLLMADEPTAGLDVTIQIQILDLFRTLVAETGAASLLVTRDLANVAHYCDRVLVLQAGRLVELAPVKVFFANPEREYSRHLIRTSMAARGEGDGDGAAVSGRAVVRATGDGSSPSQAALLEVRGLVKHFRKDRHTVHAVNGVSLTIGPGETLALVGESGSGKTTVGRCVVGLVEPTAGDILLNGVDVDRADSGSTRGRALGSHIVFQEPRESLNPRWTLGRSIEEPLLHYSDLDRVGRTARLRELLELVHLPSTYASRYPHQVTAGEQQRVAIARSVAAHPQLVVLDEPTSALDPTVKARTIDLLSSIQDELGVSYLFISHDMTAVKMIAHRIAIMYLGRVVELASADEMFASQLNPYGRALLSSVLYPDPAQPLGRFRLEGEIPSAIDLPAGCPVSSRCPLVLARCSESPPALERVGLLERWSACFRTDEILDAGGPDALQETEGRPIDMTKEVS